MQNLFAVLISVFILSLFGKKDKKNNVTLPQMTNTLPLLTDEQLKAAFKNLANKYGVSIAKAVEQIYRLETAHFKSLGFKNTYGAGALGYNTPNFGWGNTNLNSYGVSKLWDYVVNGKTYHYLVFPSINLGLNFLADYLVKYSKGNDITPGIQRWGSAPGYLDKVLKVTHKFN